LIAVGAQAAAFVFGFWQLTEASPTPANAKLLAAGGLVGSLLVLVATVHLAQRGWLPVVAVSAFLGFGLVAGLFIAAELPNMPGGMFSDLFLYGGLAVTYGVPISIGLVVAALIARSAGKPWWPSLLAAPVWLETGLHTAALVGLLFRAEAVAQAASIVLLGT
jgi:hypothetical protein